MRCKVFCIWLTYDFLVTGFWVLVLVPSPKRGKLSPDGAIILSPPFKGGVAAVQ